LRCRGGEKTKEILEKGVKKGDDWTLVFIATVGGGEKIRVSNLKRRRGRGGVPQEKKKSQ